MATKEELVAFGQAHGIAVDMSMLKADIEAAISDAGYDPTTPEENVTEEPTAEPTAVEDVVKTSSDAQWSTYWRPDQQREGEVTPPPGPQTMQERGYADEGEPVADGVVNEEVAPDDAVAEDAEVHEEAT